MNIFMELPKTRKGKEALSTQLAKFHAEYAAKTIQNLPCPTEQKLALMDAIIRDIRQSQKRT